MTLARALGSHGCSFATRPRRPRSARRCARGSPRTCPRTSAAAAAAPRASRTGDASGAAKLGEAGYAAISWPKEYGGGGAPYSHQAILLEELAKAQAPGHISVIGLGMAGPTIIARGNDEQKARYLSKILSAEEIWCQGFSEPGAGSDLAAVRTRAVRNGDHYVVNGQKVWSSYAHLADWCILVTLEDPDAPRYQGLTYLLVDMHSPGVETRPLTQITGEAEFNEIFFTDVEVPVENVVGEPGDGWAGGDDDADARAGGARVRALRRVRGRRRQAARARPRPRPRRPAARPDRAELDRAAGAQVDELPRADAADRDGRARPRGVDPEAALVGGEPAAREARARAARARGAAPGRRGLLAVARPPQPRQHDRGRDVGDPPQHHRRARARAAQGDADALRVHTRAGGAPRRGAALARGALPARAGRRARRLRGGLGSRVVGRARGARLARRVRLGGRGRRGARLPRGGGSLRGARARALPGAVLLDGRARAAGARRRRTAPLSPPARRAGRRRSTGSSPTSRSSTACSPPTAPSRPRARP